MRGHGLELVAQSEESQGRRRNRKVWWVFTALVALILAGVVAAALYLGVLMSSARHVEHQDMLGGGSDGPVASKPADGPLDILLLGSDTRGGSDTGRSDVTMLAHVNATRDKVYLVSFPRDLWVDVPGHGKAKINAAYAHGGPQLTTRTLEELVGVRIDHAAMVDFDGFARLTTELGGVTVTNRHASSNLGYSWPAGPVTLQGDEALAFVRERYDLPHGDLDRAQRQRDVVQAIAARLLSREVLTDPVRLARTVDQLSRHVTVDDGLTTGRMVDLARSMNLSGSGDVLSLQAPVAGFSRSADGQAIDLVDQPRMKQLAKALQEDTMDMYLAANPATTQPGR